MIKKCKKKGILLLLSTTTNHETNKNNNNINIYEVVIQAVCQHQEGDHWNNK